eukprot:tig00000269_g23773.t1
MADAPPSPPREHMPTLDLRRKAAEVPPGWALEKLIIEDSLIDHTNAVRCLLSQGDNTLFSGGDDNVVKLWDLESMHPTWNFTGHTNWLTQLAIDADGMQLFSASYDTTIRIWDLHKGVCKGVLEGHTKPVLTLQNAGGNVVYSSGVDKSVRVWDARTHKCEQNAESHTDAVTSSALHGNHVITGSRDGLIILWDRATMTPVKRIKAHSEWVLSLLVSEDVLYSGSDDNSIKLWDLSVAGGDNLHQLAAFRGHRNGVRSLAISQEGGALFSGAVDDTIGVWDLKQRKMVDLLQLPSKRLTKSEDRPYHTQQQAVLSLAVSGPRLFSGLYDSTIKMWTRKGRPSVIVDS